MSFLLKYAVKSKVNGLLNDNSSSTGVGVGAGIGAMATDAWSSTKDKSRDGVNAVKRWWRGGQCSRAGCSTDKESGCDFCKYHKCLLCIRRRGRKGPYCEVHLPSYLRSDAREN